MYKQRRDNLSKRFQNGSIAVFFSGKAPKSTSDSYYKFRENKNFFYLTGLTREEFILCQVIRPDGTYLETLFIEKPDYDIEKWVGRKLTKEECTEISGVQDIRFLGDFENFLHQQLLVLENVYFDFERQKLNEDLTPEENFANKIRGKYPFIKIHSSYPYLAQMRLIKDESEINEIKRAIAITKEAFADVLTSIQPDMFEYEIESTLYHGMRKRGADRNSFDTIAASGKDACILHYVDNNKKLVSGDLILLDFGAQYNCYAGDISRTIPVNGKFSERQKQIYNIVLKAQQEVINAMQVGTHFSRLNEVCKESLSNSLLEIGLIKERSELSKYYYHGVSHYLGLDVHDIGSRDEHLKNGMLLTCEPGLYIAEEGIGIRIEDDILITDDGPVNLSISIPKDPETLEKIIQKIV